MCPDVARPSGPMRGGRTAGRYKAGEPGPVLDAASLAQRGKTQFMNCFTSYHTDMLCC